MRIVSYNILNGGVGRADPIGEVLQAQNADIIVLIEADDAWVVDRIARRLKMDHVTGKGDQHAAAILSRWPIASSMNYAAIDADGPRSWLDVRLVPAEKSPLHVIAVHLTARASLDHEARRVAELERVLAATRPMREAGTPHALVGDFNANAPQQRITIDRCKASTREAFAANGDLIPRDAIDLLLRHGYVDSMAAARGDEAFDAVTFSTHEPGQRVDYVFTHGLVAEDAWIEQDRLATYASDHYPIGATLGPPAGASK